MVRAIFHHHNLSIWFAAVALAKPNELRGTQKPLGRKSQSYGFCRNEVFCKCFLQAIPVPPQKNTPHIISSNASFSNHTLPKRKRCSMK